MMMTGAVMIKKKIMLSMVAVLFAVIMSFTFSACGHRGGEFVVSGVSAEDIVMDDIVADLPAISLVNIDGEIKAAAADDFWFNARYVYVQYGRIYIKGSAPGEFTDNLEIVYRWDRTIKTTVTVKKMFVPLIGISLNTNNGRNNCPVGGVVQIVPTFTPQNASDKDIFYEIIEGGDFAEITSGGALSVGEDVGIGAVIAIRGQAGDIISDLIVTVTPPEISYSFVTFAETEIVTSVIDTYTEYQSFPELDLAYLYSIGYRDVNFSFFIEAREERDGYVELYIDLRKINGGAWCIYESENYFDIGGVGWHDYADDGYGAKTWGYIVDDTGHTEDLTIKNIIKDCGANPEVRLSCGANGGRWVHGWSSITITVS
jgi:hypothetical protein